MEASAQAQADPKQKSNKKWQVYNGDIVFLKQGSVQTVPSLSKRLETVTDPVVGLHYVWEYRSPSRTVPPHYQCRLCNVPLLLSEMVCHLIGWKHCFKYIKHIHPEKVSSQRDDVKKDKKVLKAIAVGVEKAEGRGQIKVLFREPGDVPVFQNMRSAFPTAIESAAPSVLLGPVPGGFHSGMMGDRMIEGSMHTAPDGFGMGPRREEMGRQYPDNLFMNGSDRMMSANVAGSSNTLETLLRCLDSFRIECEDDAQIVLKITQKLADVLMDYRLRNITWRSRLNSSCPLLSSDRFRNSPSRFYK